jgi:chorismate mutase/prephenate dehydratase
MPDRRRHDRPPAKPGQQQVPDDAVRAEAASELEGLRREIDALDSRIVALLNERVRLGRSIGQAKTRAGWSGIRDPRREREVLLRVSMANGGPLGQADLLAIYRRVIAATRAIEDDDRRASAGGNAAGSGSGPSAPGKRA